MKSLSTVTTNTLIVIIVFMLSLDHYHTNHVHAASPSSKYRRQQPKQLNNDINSIMEGDAESSSERRRDHLPSMWV